MTSGGECDGKRIIPIGLFNVLRKIFSLSSHEAARLENELKIAGSISADGKRGNAGNQGINCL
jgi:hypothetical protein